MADQLHSDSVLQNLQQILNDPLFWGAGIVVLTYAWLRFAQRPTGMAAQAYSDTDPAALARAFTTASRYRFMQCVYVALFALAYAGLVVVFSIPGLRAIAAEFAGIFGAVPASFGPETGVKVATWAGTLLSVLLPQVPWLKGLDNTLRGKLHAAAEIPIRAHVLASQMRQHPFCFNQRYLLRRLGREFGAEHAHAIVDAALCDDDTPLHHYARLRYLQLAIDDLAARNPRFAAFRREHSEAFNGLFKRADDLKARFLPRMMAERRDPTSGRVVVNGDEEDRLGELVRERLDYIYDRLIPLLACAVLFTSRSRDAMHDQLLRLGFDWRDEKVGIDLPTLIYSYLIVFTATAMTASMLWLYLESPELGMGITPTDLKLFVIWGAWGGLIHTLALLCVVLVRFSWGVKGASGGATFDRQMLSYFFIGVLAWLVGSAVNFLSSWLHEILTPDAVGLTVADRNDLFLWALVYSATGVSFAILTDWRQEFAYRRLFDACVQGVLTGGVALAVTRVVLHGNEGTYASLPVEALNLLAPMLSFVIGFSLGLLLPSHFRIKSVPRSRRVAVIGAGISGLACADRLRHRGYEVAVFEQHLGAGGRVGSWQLDGQPFDLGAPYCTVRTSAFRHEVDELIRDGHAAEWAGNHVTLRNGIVENTADQSRRFVALPTMNAISRRFAESIGVYNETKIRGLRRASDGKWQLLTEDGITTDTYDIVVAAIPAPEAAELLADTGASFLDDLSNVRMAPRNVVAVAFEQPLNLNFSSALIRTDNGKRHPVLYWVARDSSKPGRPPGERWVLHANDSWSVENEHLSGDQVRDALLRAFWEVTGCAPVAPEVHKAIRWKFAAVREGLRGQPPFDPRLGVGACGDWCSGGWIEDAWTNGRLMAARVNVSLAEALWTRLAYVGGLLGERLRDSGRPAHGSPAGLSTRVPSGS